MKYELLHDTIAQQIFDKASAKSKRRRVVERLIENKYQFYVEKETYLTQDELDIILPIIPSLALSETRLQFIKKSKRRIKIRRWIIGTGSLILLLTLIISIFSTREANKERYRRKVMDEANRVEYLASSEEKNNPTLAMYLANYAYQYADQKTGLAARIRGNIYQDNQIGLQTTRFLGHIDKIYSVAFSPTGQYILTGSTDRTAILWDLKGTPIQQFKGHTQQVNAVAFSPKCPKGSNCPYGNGKTILTGSLDSTAILWDLKGNPIQQFKNGHTDLIHGVAFSPDGQKILTCSKDKTAILWNMKGQILQRFIGHTDEVYAVAFSPICASTNNSPFHNDQVILTGSKDGKAILWSEAGDSIRQFQEHLGSVYGVAFAPDGQKIITGSEDKTAIIWHINGHVLQHLKHHKERVFAVNFSPPCPEGQDCPLGDGKTILTTSLDKTAILSDINGNIIHRFKGHSNPILSANFAPDSKTIVTGSWDRTAILWDINRSTNRQFKGHTDYIYKAVFSPPCPKNMDCPFRILTASKDHTAILWDKSGNLIQEFKHNGAVRSVAFSPPCPEGQDCPFENGQTILTGSSDHTAILWNMEGMPIQQFKGHTDEVYSVAFSPNGQSILTASRDRTARLWNLKGELLELFRMDGEVHTAIFSPDGQSILTTSGAKKAILWNLRGRPIRQFKGHHKAIFSAAFSPDGQTILTGSADGIAILWDLKGHILKKFRSSTHIFSVDFSPNGRQILTSSRDKTAILWDLKGKQLKRFKHHQDMVFSATFSPPCPAESDCPFGNGQTLLMASADATASLWHITQDTMIQSFNRHKSIITSVAFSPTCPTASDCPHNNQLTILTGSHDATAILWDQNSQPIRYFKKHRKAINSVAYAPPCPDNSFCPYGNGQTILTGSADKTAILWSIQKGTVIKTFKGHRKEVHAVAFLKNTTQILTGSGDQTAILWDIATARPLQQFEGHTGAVLTIAISPNQRYILTGSADSSAILWDRTGAIIQQFKGHYDMIHAVAFSPDGQTIITGSRDYSAILWNLRGQPLRYFRNHNSSIRSVAFSADGNTILTGSSDNTAILWDIAGNFLQQFKSHTGDIHSVAFGMDGQTILTGGQDKRAILWDNLVIPYFSHPLKFEFTYDECLKYHLPFNYKQVKNSSILWDYSYHYYRKVYPLSIHRKDHNYKLTIQQKIAHLDTAARLLDELINDRKLLVYRSNLAHTYEKIAEHYATTPNLKQTNAYNQKAAILYENLIKDQKNTSHNIRQLKQLYARWIKQLKKMNKTTVIPAIQQKLNYLMSNPKVRKRK